MDNQIPGFPDKFASFVKSSAVDPKVREVYESLHKFAVSPARERWIKQAGKCRKAAFENEFFTESEIADMRRIGEEPHVINKLVSGIQGASSVVTSQNPRVEVLPLRDSDPYLAELLRAGIEHVWLKNHGNEIVYDFTESRNTDGIGTIYAMRDNNKGPFGAVVFEEDDTKLWYWDAESRKRDRSDTDLIKAQLRSLRYIKANYDLKDEEIVSISDNFENKGDTTDTKTGEDNYRHSPDDTGSTPGETARMVWEIEAYMLRTETEHWAVLMFGGVPQVARFADARSRKEALDAIERIKQEGYPDKGTMVFPDSIHYWPRKINNRYLRIVVGDKLIMQHNPDGDPTTDDPDQSEVKNPLGLDSDGDPVLPVIFYYAQRTDKAYYHSPTFFAIDPNKSLCKHETQYTLALSKNLSAPIVRDSTGTRWRDPSHPDAPGNEILVDKGTGPPFRLNPGDINFAALSVRIADGKMDIDDAYMLSEVLKGKVPQGLERISGRLGLALQESSTLMHNPAHKGLEAAMARLGKTLLAIMLKSWPRSKWEALVTDDRIKEFQPMGEGSRTPDIDKTDELIEQEMQERKTRWAAAINKLDRDGISVVDFNVAITAGSSLPTNRLLRKEEAIEMYKINLYDRRAALEHSEDPKAREISERMDKREMEMAQAGMKIKRR